MPDVKPCKRGHTSGRYPSGNCVQCAIERAAAWYRNNQVRAKKYRKDYYSRNRDEMISRAAAWNKENRERRLEIVRRSGEKHADRRIQYFAKNRDRLLRSKQLYYVRNRERLNERMRAYKKNNKEKINAINASRRAVTRGAQGRFNKRDVDLLIIQQCGLCNLCGIQLQTFHIDHIFPVSRGGSNCIENLQLLCPPCNLSKGASVPLTTP